MSDYISRQAAIDAIERNAYRHTYINQIVGIIKDLPSVQEQQWIPVTEKLPEKFQACIVTDERRQCAYEYDYNPENEFTKKYGWLCSGRKIIAWMPLPEPYTEVKEE